MEEKNTISGNAKSFIKRCILIGALFFSVNSFSQYVYIPDPNFRTFLNQLYTNCMAGDSLDTTCTAIITETDVNLTGRNISDLTGIEYFDNLLRLDCYNNDLTSVPNLPASLLSFWCEYNQITTINGGLPANLQRLECGNNQITTISNLPSSIEILYCNSNQLTGLSSLPPLLRELDCNSNQLTSLPSLPSSLELINCFNNSLTSLPALPASLRELLCGNNQLTSLPALPSPLIALNCSDNQLTSIPALPAGFDRLYCWNNMLTALPSLPSSLRILVCYENMLTNLPDLSSSLETLNCRSNDLTAMPDLPQLLRTLFCDTNQISFLPDLNDSLRELSCTYNNLICLPVLSDSLTSLSACTGNNILCLPNVPADLQNNDCSGLPVCGPSVTCPPAIGTITITAPNGGENWDAGSTQSITWTSSDVDSVSIQYSVDNGTNWINIISAVDANAGTYSWLVPASASTQVWVRVKDVTDSLVADTSDAVFTISIPVAPVFVITSPVGGETWEVNSSHAITWINDTLSMLKIELSVDGGANWTLISSNVPADSLSYAWIVPNTPSSNAKIRISSMNDTTISSVSGIFTISAPTYVKELQAKQPKIYPNPGNGHFTIDMIGEVMVALIIYDMKGNEVYMMKNESTNQGRLTLNLTHLDSGIYMVKSTVGEQRLMEKLVIIQ